MHRVCCHCKADLGDIDVGEHLADETSHGVCSACALLLQALAVLTDQAEGRLVPSEETAQLVRDIHAHLYDGADQQGGAA